jgi:hypothetical protein
MLTGKTALVTGSTSGIGLGIALTLAQRGARLMINGFGDSEAALAQVRQHDPQAVYHGADMSQPAQIEDMVESCQQQLGSCDILINNAGIQRVALLKASTSKKPSAACWPRSSLRCSSRRRSSLPNSSSSCVRRPPTTCGAWPGTWTAAGRHSSRSLPEHLAPLPAKPVVHGGDRAVDGDPAGRAAG